MIRGLVVFVGLYLLGAVGVSVAVLAVITWLDGRHEVPW